ncbi:MAG: oligosaccharide repeat unit polymerase [Ignavibacteriaceae bacterium]|nr:oligosaccharide repeat unit polymerase [Ignavibacteriaceae bacterium]
MLVSLLAIVTSRAVLGKWFNHISFYFTLWAAMVSFYEMKLMAYFDLSDRFWLAVFAGSLSFLFGSLLYPAIKKAFEKNKPEETESDPLYKIFFESDSLLNNIILWCSIIGIVSAIHHWMVLIDMFGSFTKVLINYNVIYRLRVENKIEGLIPYAFVMAFVGVFFAGIKVAKEGKVGLLSLSPFIGVMLRELAKVGRAGILFAFMMFISVIFLSRYSIQKNSHQKSKSFFNKSSILPLLIIIGLMIGSAGLVRTFRGTFESYKAAGSSLNKTAGGFFITPSLYLYISSHAGVFSKYLDKDYDKDFPPGETTFFSVYNILSKFDFVEAPEMYDKGFFIPMWSNTSTVYRYLHQDFGLLGLFIPPFLTGLLASFFWVRFYERGKISDLLLLSYIYIGIGMSFMILVTKISIWLISLVAVYLIIRAVQFHRNYSARVFTPIKSGS